jgi:cyclopropane fatty-acyl-phospholipid synthase-like methyltransferase
MSTTETIKSVWDGYEDEKRRQELSHWRGVGKWADDRKWIGVGKNTVRRIYNLQRWLKTERLEKGGNASVLEWGPGGGSNAFAFRDYCEAYYGVDISEKNLTETQRMLKEAGSTDFFKPILLNEAPETVFASVRKPIDLFLSTAVFQHFPSKDYGLEVLSALRSISKPGTLGLIQIRYDNGEDKFSPITSLDQYKSKFITATSYQIDEFWNACNDAGFEVQYLAELNPKSHYATYYLSVPKFQPPIE